MSGVSVVGCGIAGFSQLTPEALDCIRNSSSLWLNPPEGFREISGNGRAEDITSLYIDGGIDTENYARVLKATFDAVALGTTSLVVPGHPRFGSTLVALIERRCAELGIQFSVYPAISSFDGVMNDLKFDPIERGTLLVDANRLLLFRYVLEPAVNIVIYSVCSIGTVKTNVSSAGSTTSLHLLRDYLLLFFPPEHVVQLVSTAHPERPVSKSVSTPLNLLPEYWSHVDFNTSLFIPCVKPRSIDKAYLSRLRGEPESTSS